MRGYSLVLIVLLYGCWVADDQQTTWTCTQQLVAEGRTGREGRQTLAMRTCGVSHGQGKLDCSEICCLPALPCTAALVVAFHYIQGESASLGSFGAIR